MRWEAFSEYMLARGCQVCRLSFPGAGHNPTVVRAAVRKVRESFPKATALFGANDRIALNLLFECQRQDIAVPDQISIVGFDDLEIGRWCEPSLTSISQPLEEIGRRAIEMLLQQIQGKANPRPDSTVLPVTLIERNSSSLVAEANSK